MTRSPVQSPPCGCRASVIVSGSPPSAGIFFSLPSAKNAIIRLSGDQNGVSVAVVFIKGRPSSESSGLTQSRFRPSTPVPNTISRPSGDSRGQLPVV